MAIAPQFGSIVPSQQQQTLANNYLNFTGGQNDFSQQYLPELYEAEVERYGNRTLSGFLRMVGAEMPMTSDQVIWSEQNRLHIAYNNCTSASGAGTITIPVTAAGAAVPVVNVISPGATIVVMDQFGGEAKCFVRTSDTRLAGGGGNPGQLVVEPYGFATLAAAGIADGAGKKIFVYGSDFQKGTSTANAAVGANTYAANNNPMVTVDPSFTQFSNSPIIIRSTYTINGSDTAQIGWVEVATEDGTGGYLWYLKAESETRLRFEDYLEMAMVEGELSAGGPAALTNQSGGSQGLFSAISQRGNVQARIYSCCWIRCF